MCRKRGVADRLGADLDLLDQPPVCELQQFVQRLAATLQHRTGHGVLLDFRFVQIENPLAMGNGQVDQRFFNLLVGHFGLLSGQGHLAFG